MKKKSIFIIANLVLLVWILSLLRVIELEVSITITVAVFGLDNAAHIFHGNDNKQYISIHTGRSKIVFNPGAVGNLGHFLTQQAACVFPQGLHILHSKQASELYLIPAGNQKQSWMPRRQRPKHSLW